MQATEQVISASSAPCDPAHAAPIYASKGFLGDARLELNRGSLRLVIRRDRHGFTALLRNLNFVQFAFAIGEENCTRILSGRVGRSLWLGSASFELRDSEVSRVAEFITQGGAA